MTFRSSLVPPDMCRMKTLEDALTWLYLKGVSSGEMGAALKALFGLDAVGLSANVVSRLKRGWTAEYVRLRWTMSQSSKMGRRRSQRLARH